MHQREETKKKLLGEGGQWSWITGSKQYWLTTWDDRTIPIFGTKGL